MIIREDETRRLTWNNILAQNINELQIYEMYIGKVKLPCTIKSPLRNEHHPSFSLYTNAVGNLFWKDQATGEHGNCVDFIMLKFKIDYYCALNKINTDFRLGLNGAKTTLNVEYHEIPIKRDIITDRIILAVTIHEEEGTPTYTTSDIDYWTKRGITDIPTRLIRNRTYSAKYVFRNGRLFWTYTKDSPIYAYSYNPIENDWRWKCYRPYADRGNNKFYNDMLGVSARCIHGLWYLKHSDDKLIITKSGKDCIVGDELGYNVVATQGEGMFIADDILTDMRERYKKIYLLYDNDWDKEINRGQEYAAKLVQKYDFLHNIHVPNVYNCTDLDELIIKIGKKETYNVINKLIL